MSIDFIRSFYARLDSLENWTQAQNGRLDWVGVWGSRKIPPGARKPSARFALAFSFVCVNREAVNSLLFCNGHFFRTRQKVGHAFTPILTSVCKTPTSTLQQWPPEHFPGGKVITPQLITRSRLFKGWITLSNG